MDFVCRLCLAEETPLLQSDESFRSNYFLLTNIEIKIKDGLPQDVCVSCAQTVGSFVQFREKCLRSESYLQQRLEKKTNIKIEKEIDTCEDNENINEDFICHSDEETGDGANIEIKKENEADEVLIKLINKTSDSPQRTDTEVSNKCMETKTAKTRKKRQNNKVNESDKNVLEYKNPRICRLRNKPQVVPETTNVEDDKKNVNKEAFMFDENVLGCGICMTSFKKGEDKLLEVHLETHRNQAECEICFDGFSEWPQIISHRIKHVVPKHRKCFICKESVGDTYKMEFHYKKMHTDLDPILKCQYCFKTFESVAKIRRHVVRHRKVTTQCPICKKSVLHMVPHMELHNKEKKYSCKLCALSFKTSRELWYHTGTQHTKSLKCNKCSRLYVKQSSLDKHVCPPDTFICPICGKEVKMKRRKRHMNTHEDVRDYKCTICPAVYKNRNNLKSHIDRHNETPRNTCEFCEKKFYSRGVLMKHRRIHTGEKPHVCKICNKGFTATHNLRVHMKVHGLDLIVKRPKPEGKTSVDKKKKVK